MTKRYPTRRARLEAAVERAIDVLDHLDGDECVEPDEDDDSSDLEPSLGSPNARMDQSCWSAGSTQDVEGLDDDLEPWLGWTLDGVKGDSDDREDEARVRRRRAA